MAKSFIRTKVLYFISGVVPTAGQAVQIEELLQAGKDVFQRNAMVVSDTDSLEAFDELAGAVPKRYLRAAKGAAAVEADEENGVVAVEAVAGRVVHPEPDEPAAEKGEEAPVDPAATPAPVTPAPAAGGAQKPAEPAKAPGWKPNA